MCCQSLDKHDLQSGHVTRLHVLLLHISPASSCFGAILHSLVLNACSQTSSISRKDVIILLVLHHELRFRCSSAKLTNSCITAQVYYHIDVEHHQDFRLLPGTTCVRYQVILVIRGPTCFIPSCLATIQGCQDMSLGLGQVALSETYLPKWSEMIMIGCMWSSQYARFRSEFV